MVAHKLYGMLIASVIIVGTVKTSSTWRDALNLNSLKSYLAALYTGTQETAQAAKPEITAANKFEQASYDACIDFVADFLSTNLGAFTPDEQTTLLKFKKMMVQKLYQDETRRAALAQDIDAKIAILKKK